MNARYAAVMAFYAYLTLKAAPDRLGVPEGYIVGAAASYALWVTVGRDFAYGADSNY